MPGYIRAEALKGAIAVVVEPGFVVTMVDGDHTISDDLIVQDERHIYCTEANLERLRKYRFVGQKFFPIDTPPRQ